MFNVLNMIPLVGVGKADNVRGRKTHHQSLRTREDFAHTLLFVNFFHFFFHPDKNDEDVEHET
jgi:hypothetical protein